MSTHRPTHRARRSRWLGIAAAAALLAAAAVGITTLRHNTAHAVHPGASAEAANAAGVTAGGPDRPLPGALAGVLPEAWQAPASDASVPSAHEVFKGRNAPDADASAPTF